jgi:hypothetical protein
MKIAGTLAFRFTKLSFINFNAYFGLSTLLMKRYTLLISLLIPVILLKAQFKIIAESPQFEEPGDGSTRLAQLRNGNTVFISVSYKGGIDLHIYDSKHKEKLSRNVDHGLGKLKDTYLSGIVLQNDNFVFFFSERNKSRLDLHRLIVEAKTGNLKKTEILSTINTASKFEREDGLKNGFTIEQDVNSDCYAIVKYHTPDKKNQEIELVHYGPDNKEINKTSWSPKSNVFNSFVNIDVLVFGAEKIDFIYAVQNYNSKAHGGSQLYNGRLSKGSDKIEIDKIPFLENLRELGGFARYHSATGKVLLTVVGKEKISSDGYDGGIAIYDPETFRVEKKISLESTSSDTKAKELFGRKNGFAGLPQNLFLHRDGGFAVAFQELITQSSEKYTNTVLEDVVVKVFDKEGNETSQNYLPMEQFLYPGDVLQTFYHAHRQFGQQRMNAGNQFKSFNYLNINGKPYLFANDVEKNEQLIRKGRVQRVLGIGDCDAFYFPLGGKDLIPVRNNLFEEGRRGHHSFAMFQGMSYDEATNTIAMIKMDRDNGRKESKIVWVTP